MTENSGGSWLIIKTDNSQQVFLGGLVIPQRSERSHFGEPWEWSNDKGLLGIVSLHSPPLWTEHLFCSFDYTVNTGQTQSTWKTQTSCVVTAVFCWQATNTVFIISNTHFIRVLVCQDQLLIKIKWMKVRIPSGCLVPRKGNQPPWKGSRSSTEPCSRSDHGAPSSRHR